MGLQTVMSDALAEPISFAEFPCSNDELPEAGQPIYSVEEAYAIFDKASAADSLPQEGQEPAAWATIIFRRADGQRLQVGQSDAGCLLILLRTSSTPTRISI